MTLYRLAARDLQMEMQHRGRNEFECHVHVINVELDERNVMAPDRGAKHANRRAERAHITSSPRSEAYSQTTSGLLNSP